MSPTVEAVDWTTIRVPYRDVPETHMERRHAWWNYFDVFEVELADGSVGVGESHVGWPTEEYGPAAERVRDTEAAGHLWDDSLPEGLQRALFDAVGRSLGVPIHELLGEQVHEETPLSWWCIDMTKEDWLAECETAIERGYTSVKLKGRPWRDVREQVAYLGEHLPESFDISIDFNSTLLDAERAIPLLQEIDQYPQVHAIEGPIPYDDVAGDRRIRDAIDAKLALHYGTPPPAEGLCEGVPEEFVFYGAPPGESMAQAHVAAMADVPGWLQYVGTGLTAAFMLHYGAVFETATRPGVSCYELHEHPILTERIEVEDGYATVPDGPGLGYEVDRDALATYEVEKPETEPNPAVLTEVSWPDGKRAYMASNEQTGHVTDGEFPFYEPGVSTRTVPDDGSDTWQTVYERALAENPYYADDDPFA
jgi:galactonate dehydratase